MSDLKGALVGGGFFAAFQAEGWQRVRGARIAAVVDIDADRARTFAARWDIPRVYTSAAEMLDKERPDFVDIATRPDSHLALTTLAADHKVHVICQKPLAPTYEESAAVVRACRERGVRLLAHENWRWQAWYRVCKRLLDEGAIGQLFYVGFQMRTGDGRGADPYTAQPYFRQMEKLLVYETLVHYLDTFRFFAGDIRQVYCRSRRVNPIIAGEDVSLIQVHFADADGLIDANRISGPFPPDPTFGVMRLEGDRGLVRVSPDGRVWLTKHGEPEQPVIYDIPTIGYRGDSVFALQQHITDALTSGRPAECEGDDYLRTTAAVFACYQSAAENRPVDPSSIMKGSR